MFIKKINKGDKTYYILCVYDNVAKVWRETFIKEKTALALINSGAKCKELPTK